MKNKKFVRLVAILYALAFCVGVGLIGFRAWSSKACTEQQLSVQEAQWSSVIDNHPVSWAGYDAESLVTTDSDPYLVWQVNGAVRGLRMQIRSSQPIRDPMLYYTTAENQPWDASRTIPLAECDPEQGIYTFALPGSISVHALRLDPTSSAGAFFELDEVTLNPTASAFALTTGELLMLLAAPLLAALLVQEVAAFRRP